MCGIKGALRIRAPYSIVTLAYHYLNKVFSYPLQGYKHKRSEHSVFLVIVPMIRQYRQHEVNKTEPPTLFSENNKYLGRTSVIKFWLVFLVAIGGLQMFQRKYCFSLNCDEYRILMQSLIRFKNSLIQKGSPSDLIDDIIMSVAKASAR